MSGVVFDSFAVATVDAYVLIEDAEAYALGTYPAPTAWSVETDITMKQRVLAQATRIINNLAYKSEKVNESQSNEFPRLDYPVVPQNIKDACCEIAFSLMDGVDIDLEFENLGLVSLGYGNVRATYDRANQPQHILSGVPSIKAWRLLLPYLSDPKKIVIGRVS